MTRYTWKDGCFRDAAGEPMPIPEREGVCMPQVLSDTPEYISPVTGKPVDGRAARREDLKRSGCIEAPPRKERGYKNLRFIQKHNIPLEKVAASARDAVAKARSL